MPGNLQLSLSVQLCSHTVQSILKGIPVGGGDGRLGEAGRGREAAGGGAGGAEGGPSAASFFWGGPTAASYARCICESVRFTNLCGLPCADLPGTCDKPKPFADVQETAALADI